MNNKATDWFNEVPSVPDPWQDNKPKLTQKEIENAAEIYRTFVDPVSQNILYHVMRRKCHKDTFNKWWPLVAHYNKSPVDDAYSIDQYIKDNNLDCPNAPCHCGACDCK